MAPEPALFRMLRAGRADGADLDNALDALAQVFCRRAAAERLGAHFTCTEANVVAWVLAASRHFDAAFVWLEEHAANDEDEDDVHARILDAIRQVAQRY